MRSHKSLLLVVAMLFYLCAGETAHAQLYAEVKLQETDLEPEAGGSADLIIAGLYGLSTRIQIELQGIPLGQHAWHFHNGSCEDQGPVVIDLSKLVGDLEADDDKNIYADVTITGRVPTEKRYLDVHQFSTEDGTGPIITCGNVERVAP